MSDVGFHGQGTYNLSAGSCVAPSHWFVVGRYSDGPGEFNVSGTGTFLHGTNDTGRLFRIGEEGVGVLNVSGSGSVVSAGNAVMVGDRPRDDVWGGQRVGTRGVFRPHARSPALDDVKPDATIRALSELPALTARW